MQINDSRCAFPINTFKGVPIGEVFSTDKVRVAMRVRPHQTLDFNAINLETGDKLRFDDNTRINMLDAAVVIRD